MRDAAAILLRRFEANVQLMMVARTLPMETGRRQVEALMEGRRRLTEAVAALIEPDRALLRRSPGTTAGMLVLLVIASVRSELADPDVLDADGWSPCCSTACWSARPTPRGSRLTMLIQLLRTHLRPYKRPIALVVLLQLVQTLATLYLPTLNADIIDNGVVTGDTGYIMRIGGMMLGVTAGADRLRRSAPSTSAPAPRWRSAGTCAPRIFDRVQELLGPRGRPVRRAVADHPHHQRRPAGPDAGADDLHADGVRADHVRRRHHPGARARTCRCPALLLVVVPVLVVAVSLVIVADAAAVPHHAGAHRPVNRVLREQITGIRVIRAFVRDEHEQDRFAEANADADATCRWPSAG